VIGDAGRAENGCRPPRRRDRHRGRVRGLATLPFGEDPGGVSFADAADRYDPGFFVGRSHTPGMDYTQFLADVVHEPTQSGGEGFDLTVADVSEVTGPGRVDFGGGELTAAETEPHATEKRDPDDDYGWWNLDAGQYLLSYNESLTSSDLRVTVQTREELLARGAFHPTLQVTSLPDVPLSVGGAGLRLKENARVSTLVAAEPA